MQRVTKALRNSIASNRADSMWQRSIDCCKLLGQLPDLGPEQLSTALSWQADALLHLEQYEEALTAIEHAFKLQPSCCNAAILTRFVNEQ